MVVQGWYTPAGNHHISHPSRHFLSKWFFELSIKSAGRCFFSFPSRGIVYCTLSHSLLGGICTSTKHIPFGGWFPWDPHDVGIHRNLWRCLLAKGSAHGNDDGSDRRLFQHTPSNLYQQAYLSRKTSFHSWIGCVCTWDFFWGVCCTVTFLENFCHLTKCFTHFQIAESTNVGWGGWHLLWHIRYWN